MLKNERYNKLIEELNDKLKKTELEIGEKSESSTIEIYKIVRFSLLAKYIKSTKAIAVLDMNGFFEDAKIILRTVYEIMIILLYCNINQEEYFNRFKKYRCVTIKKYIGTLTDDCDDSIKNLYYNIYMLNCEDVHSDFSGIINNYLILSNNQLIINADMKKDLNYTNIIQSLEEISKKLNYIKFDW